jgi:hypothetical protein
MGRLRDPNHHRRGPAQRPIGRRALLCIVLLAGAGLAAVTLLTVFITLGSLMLAGVGVITVARHLHRRRYRQVSCGHSATMSAPGAALDPPPDVEWHATRTRFAQLCSEYGQFECDPLAVLRLPALADVTVPSTGRFVDSFAEAQALNTDIEPAPAHRARFVTAVDQAWRAWHAARDTAERIRLAGIPAQEHATVQRAIKLLIMARDSDHDAERIAAYAKARAELAKLDRSGILKLPPAAASALDTAARHQLPASQPPLSLQRDMSG